jgi:uncharacterized membrane protein
MVTKQVKDQVKETAEAAPSVAPTNELGAALRRLAGTIATRTVTSMAEKVTSTSGRLTEYAGGGEGGLLSALTGGSGVKGKALAGAVKGGVAGMLENVQDRVQNVFGGGGGGRKVKLKFTNIVESIDVGVPVDLAYDQWTQFTEFPSFMKKVESVEQVSDEKLNWKAQIWWSHRTWESTILEQVPDERIVWRSKAPKGHVDGAVTFHELAPDLTRILLVLEYHPQGFMERTGNLWRAQGRRARLELKHFRRHVMTNTILHPDEVEGWRGEIRDGRVVDEGEEEGREPEPSSAAEAEDRGYEEEEEEPEQEKERPARRAAHAGAGTARGSSR